MEHLATNLPAVNPYAVAISALVMIVIGALWYSPTLFGKAWMRHSGIRPGDIRQHELRRNYIITILVALLTAYLLAILANHIGHSLHLFCGVALVWLFIMLEQLNGFLWQREPFSLFLLQTFRSLFSLLAGGLVFYLWR